MLAASRRLTKSAIPPRIRKAADDFKATVGAARDEVKKQTGANQIQTETITRFTANR